MIDHRGSDYETANDEQLHTMGAARLRIKENQSALGADTQIEEFNLISYRIICIIFVWRSLVYSNVHFLCICLLIFFFFFFFYSFIDHYTCYIQQDK